MTEILNKSSLFRLKDSKRPFIVRETETKNSVDVELIFKIEFTIKHPGTPSLTCFKLYY